MTILDYIYMTLQIAVIVPLTMLIGFLIRNRSTWIYRKINRDYGRTLSSQEQIFITKQTTSLVNYQWQKSKSNETSTSQYVALSLIMICMFIVMFTPMMVILSFQEQWNELARPNSASDVIWFEMLESSYALIVSIVPGTMAFIAIISLIGQVEPDLRNQVVYNMNVKNNDSRSAQIEIHKNIEKMIRARQISTEHLFNQRK